MGYNDVMMMPVYERKYFINLLIQQNQKRVEYLDNEKSSTKTSKGNRQSKISGDALKNKMKNGEIPLT